MAFELAVDSWSDDLTINIVPNGGDNTWHYVSHVLSMLVNVERAAVRFLSVDDTTIDMDGRPSSGTFRHAWNVVRVVHGPTASSEPDFLVGPQYYSRVRPPNPHGSFSTRSDSKRSSVNQSKFRTAVIARDSTCLVTDVMYTYCTACHIVPLSRPDVYQEIMGVSRDPPMFKTSVGLLLRDDLHHAYDRLEWSLHHKDGVHYVHFFILGYPDAARLHGTALRPDRFRGPRTEIPDHRLVQWHYKQCVQAHSRGFSVGMGLDANR